MTHSPPDLLLTRPEPAAARFAEQIHGARVVISPLQRIEFGNDSADLDGADALVFTSENGVRAYARMNGPAGKTAFVVGPRTAEAARNLGLDVTSADGDAQDLIALLRRDARGKTLLYLRGAHVANDLAAALRGQGMTLRSHIAYRQVDQLLSAEARAVLGNKRVVVLPIFSARNAQALADALPPGKPVCAAAISDAVAQAFGLKRVRMMVVADQPNGPAMVRATQAAIDASHRLEGSGTAL